MTSPSPRRPVTRTLASAAATALLIGALVAAPTLTGTTNVGGGPAHADETAAPSSAAAPSESATPEPTPATPSAVPADPEDEASTPTPTPESTGSPSETPSVGIAPSSRDRSVAQGEAAAAVSSYGAVSGRITDADTGAPIAGIEVKWAGYNQPPGSSTPTVSVFTGNDGRYRIGARPKSVGYITVPDGVAGRFEYLPRANYQMARSDRIAILVGKERHINFSLTPGAILEGTVVDATGKPYPKDSTVIEVAEEVLDVDDSTYWRGPEFALDEDGHFIASGLTPGEKKLFVRICDTTTPHGSSAISCQAKSFGETVLYAGQTKTRHLKGSTPFDSTDDYGEYDWYEYAYFKEQLRPTVVGTLKTGRTIKASLDIWTPRPTTLKYRWYRSGTPIGGATSRTYTVKPQDAGHRLSVRVTGSREFFVTESRTSKNSARVTR